MPLGQNTFFCVFRTIKSDSRRLFGVGISLFSACTTGKRCHERRATVGRIEAIVAINKYW